ncbi:MAG: barstar family protein [Clostridia bacterium]|nr:barstar family protein [Clostridia bacterium]
MKRIVLDLRTFDDREQAHTYLQEKLNLPAYYGRNLDALHDCLLDIREDMGFLLHVPEKMERFAGGLRSVFEDVCIENPHLHLIEEEETMIANDKNAAFPRLCAHRGYNFIAPENTLPAFALAVSMGADEIELDLWPSKDGDLIVCHDPKVDRTTNGSGIISEMTTKEIRQLDAGVAYSPAFKGTKLPLFEEVLDLLGGKVIFNIHIKSPTRTKVKNEVMSQRSKEWANFYNNHIETFPPLPVGIEHVVAAYEERPLLPYPEKDFKKILDTLDAFKCREHAYIAGEKDVLFTAREMAPDIARCCLEGHMNFTIVEHALEYGCKKVQFCKNLTTQAMIDKARANGLICNLFWADSAKEARAYMDIGIDCVLTNNIGVVKAELAE